MKSETLHDVIYRETFRSHTCAGWTSNADMRAALQDARRFVLDDNMSTFLGELATAAFVRSGRQMAQRMVETLRVSARIPHRTTWFEYNLRKTQGRTSELLGRHSDPWELPKREGVLLWQHPTMDGAFQMITFLDTEGDWVIDRHGYRKYTFPVATGWTTTEQCSPWPSLFHNKSKTDSEIASGVAGYKTDTVTYCQSSLLTVPPQSEALKDLINEWSGLLRRIWALLATLNDIPALRTEVKQAKGFVARGRYRKFLEHTTITLNVPQKTYRKLARSLIAAAHRRAHQVRGHWRLDWRNPGNRICQHQWLADQVCSRCHAHRLWISEHQRGDASIGFVTHDYSVEHAS
jgi:hypothetical protein